MGRGMTSTPETENREMKCVYCKKPTRRFLRVVVGRNHPHIRPLSAHLTCGPRGLLRFRTIVRYYDFRGVE